MSDTDDTDVLLLIPPDFFLVHSDTDSSLDDIWPEHYKLHCNLVRNITEEIGDIKNRLNSIENQSEHSSFHSFDFANELNMSSRQYQFNDDEYRLEYRNPKDFQDVKYNSHSTKSTPQKPRTKLVNNSLPSTPSSDREKPRSRYRRVNTDVGFPHKISPKKTQSIHSIHQIYDRDADESSITTSPDKNKTVLGEIDQFLSHVKTIKRFVTQRKLENHFPDKEPTSLPNDLITFDNTPLKLSDLKGEGDFREKRKNLDLKDVDRFLESMEKQKQKMERSDRIVEGTEKQNYTWKMGENKNTVPDYDFGMRDIMYTQEENLKLSHKIHDFISKDKTDTNAHYSDSSDNTPVTVFENTNEIFTKKNHRPNYEIPKKQNIPNTLRHENRKEKIIEPKNIVQSNVQFLPKRTFNFEESANKNVLGVSDLWCYNQKDIIQDKNSNTFILTKLEEEKLRRQHCEKLIQDLQLKQLEMQQRLAIAVQVDCAKDAAILRFHEAWEKVADRWQSLEIERNQLAVKLNSIKGRSDIDIAEANKKVVHYETEMSKALDLAHSSQEKCNNLEFEKNSLLAELETVRSEFDEFKKRLQVIEEEKRRLKDKVAEVEKINQQEKKVVKDLQKEMNIQKQKSENEIFGYQSEIKLLKDDKCKLEKEIMDTKSSCELLENKNRNLENYVEDCKKNEKTLQQEISKLLEQIEKVKSDLRNFYQQQVEILVKDKLREFQSQLEQTEKQLHDELQNREQTIAKTAAKQLQKLTEKHNIEVQLIEEKHKEEMRLYDIQISQLRHLISTQQTKLDHMQQKRNNIAQELKSVMETQWNEALRIINNGRSPSMTPIEKVEVPKYKLQNDTDLKKILAHEELMQQIPENEKQEASINTTPRNDRHNVPELNDLQKYIKMLLDKEPGHTDGRDGRVADHNTPAVVGHNVNSIPKVSGADVVDNDKKSVKEHRNKPPWK